MELDIVAALVSTEEVDSDATPPSPTPGDLVGDVDDWAEQAPMTPRYLKVSWTHNHLDEPVLLLSEIDQGRERRKVEIWADGRHGWAGPDGSSRDTSLSEEPMPLPEEIDGMDEFSSLPADAAEFERAWRAATGE